MAKTVFVTGGTGFTGSHLVARLCRDGHQVRALARPGSRTDALSAAGARVVEGDLSDIQALKEGVRGADLVYHIAAHYRKEAGGRQAFHDVNVRGTEHLLRAAHEAGVKRFVHCSTVGVQGEIRNPPATEESPFNPGDIYQESKLEGELLARRFFDDAGLPGVVFRPVGIYGPGDTRFLKLFKAIKTRRFIMIGSGKVLYHLTYIDDLVDGIVLCGEHPAAVGQVYTLGGETYTDLNTVVRTIADVVGVPVSRLRIPAYPVWLAGLLCEMLCKPLGIEPPIYRRRVDFFIKDRAFDIAKAKRELGYAPRVSLREGIERTARWYDSEDLL